MKLVFKLLYRFYRLSSGLRYRLARRFTPAGLLMLAGLLASGLLAPDTENTVAYQGLALVAVLLIVAICFSWVFRTRFSVQRLLPRFGSVGAPLRYTVRLKNLTRRNQVGLSLLEELADPRPAFREWMALEQAEFRNELSFRFRPGLTATRLRRAKTVEAQVPPAMPGQEVETQVEVTPLRRGLLRFKAVVLGRSDPLGLCRGLMRLSLPQNALILPKRYPLPPIALPGTMKYQQGGVALASNVGRSEEFVSLRDYREGDPLRHIHWRSWAKAGKPVVKEFEDEFFVRHALVLDTFSAEPHSAVFEEAVSVAASFACTIRTQESLLDLLFVGSQTFCFTVGRGLGHTDQMLEVLASVNPCPDQPFSALERLVLTHMPSVSGCICILLAWDELRRRLIEKLRAIGVPLLVFVISPRGSKVPLEPGPMRDGPVNFHVLECGRIEESLAKLG